MSSLDLRDAEVSVGGLIRVSEHFSPVDSYGKHNLYLKHALDRVISAAMIILLSPILLVCSAAILLEGAISPAARGPIFITQERYSAGRPLKIIKFRSFLVRDGPRDERSQDDAWLINERRRTRIGTGLRKTYLDELPQLFNILKGDMSLVGPRPWPHKQYIAALAKGYQGRRLLRGGICGPRQAIKGRPHRFENKLEMEEILVRNYLSRSAICVVLLDLRIARDTLRTIGRAEGY